MRVFREEDPMDSGYTVVNNDTLWIDLSCRALGLLVRWLSKPPGVEVDTIADIINRSKRRGNKRMEGRDALYTASYELEREGFLVRRLFTNEKGQHEWAAFVRSRPVPVEERSDPDERKRATVETSRTKKTPAAKARKPARRDPIPGNPFSGLTRDDAASPQVSPNPGKPDSGDPNSENQASSYQSSLHSSLSVDASAEDAEGRDGEREAATQEDETTPAEQGGTDDVTKIVDAFVVAWLTNRNRRPYPNQIVALREDAAFLLGKGRSVRSLCDLAADMASKGWSNLGQHAQMNPEAAIRPAAVQKPWCGECNDGHAPMSAAQRMVQTDTGMAKCQCHPGYVPAQSVRA